ncbi:hypothetical protein HY950_02610 [Candidatus Gottesmanbacteria bacterium]|nr:hypothetical protein [Candidatus Gottesmanbacteria bacterium]
MFKLRTGYLISGIATGLVLLFSFVWTLPDGKLRVVFCDVGQGDAAYIRFPDGRDMLVDGGPNDRVLGCLGKHMPFWDRAIDIVAMTHPQKDHMQGLISVFDRYAVDYFVRSDVANDTEGYKELVEVVKRKKISQKFVTTGERITVGPVTLAMIWPSEEQIAKGKSSIRSHLATLQGETLQSPQSVLGSSVVGELNDYSLVFTLHYGTFDVLFTGDADNHVNYQFVGKQALDGVEVLKVPHHGSKTGMTAAFLDWIFGPPRSRAGLVPVVPESQLAVISVGKNSYGHPAEETLKALRDRAIKILRTDEKGDIEVVSDGKGWTVQ